MIRVSRDRLKCVGVLLVLTSTVVGCVGTGCGFLGPPACAGLTGIDPTGGKVGDPIQFVGSGQNGFEYVARWYAKDDPQTLAAIQAVDIDSGDKSASSIVPTIPPKVYEVLLTATDAQTAKDVCNTGRFRFEVLSAVSIDHVEVDELASTLRVVGSFPPVLPPDSPQVTLDGAALKASTFNTQQIVCKIGSSATGEVQVTAGGESSNVRKLSLLSGQVRDVVTGKSGNSQATWNLKFRVDLGDYPSQATVETSAALDSTFTWDVTGQDITGCQQLSKIGDDPPYLVLPAGSPTPTIGYFAASIKVMPLTGGGHHAVISHSAFVPNGQQIDGRACGQPTRTEDFTAGSDLVVGNLDETGNLPGGDLIVGAGSLGDAHLAWDVFICQGCP